jgi:oxaloacetate decarboxylase alpha subunit
VVDEQVMDRIMSLPRTKELQQEPAIMTLKETRKRFPASLSDEEFLLRAVMPQGQVDAMINKAPCSPHYNPETRALLKLLRDMKQRPSVAHFIVEKPGFCLQLRAGADPAAGGRADTAAAAESQSK